MKEFDFAFRINLSNNLGVGHLFRCLSIAKELQKKDKKILFLTNTHTDLNSKIEMNNFTWMNVNEYSIIKELCFIKNKLKIFKNLIVDLGFHNQVYCNYFSSKINTTIIDDLGGLRVSSKYIFNGHLEKKFQEYNFKNTETKFGFGPKYMPIREEIMKNRTKVSINKTVKKILLSFGGSDEMNMSSKIITELLNKDFEITILSGPTNKNSNKKIESEIKYIDYTENVEKLFLNHDLVISSSGMTSYELACLGIPTFFIPLDKFQFLTAKNFEINGFGKNCQILQNSPEKLVPMIKEIDYEKRKSMSDSGRKIVDGKGAYRISSKLNESD